MTNIQIYLYLIPLFLVASAVYSKYTSGEITVLDFCMCIVVSVLWPAVFIIIALIIMVGIILVPKLIMAEVSKYWDKIKDKKI